MSGVDLYKGSSTEAYSNSSNDSSVIFSSNRKGDPSLNLAPSAELARRLERQQDEIRLLQEENTRLKCREVEVSNLALRLQQQFASTQAQVDNLKSKVRLHLLQPITDDEYMALEAVPESKRDLLDTIKIGIYQQLGSMRSSSETAMKRMAEMSTTISQLTDKNRDLEIKVAERAAVSEAENEALRKRASEIAHHSSTILELEAKNKDLESRLRNAFIDQEQYLTAKLNAGVKTDEAARLAVRLEEAEMDLERYKANAECSEQKLDILKSEYYELKLKYGQRILELEAALRAADEKLKTLHDLEVESDLFVSNLATHSGPDGSISFASPDGDGVERYQTWLAMPQSRKLAHTITVTKRCLSLENKISSLQHDLELKNKQISRLQLSLEIAREALQNSNSPYFLVEKNMNELTTENEKLRSKVSFLQNDNDSLKKRLDQRNQEVRVLCSHRKDLLKIQKALQKLQGERQYPSEVVEENAKVNTKKNATSPLASPAPKSPSREEDTVRASFPSNTLQLSIPGPIEIHCD